MGDEARRFFDEFARAATGQDAEDLAGFYDDGVVHAQPGESDVFRNDARHRKWLASHLARSRRQGLREMTAIEVGGFDLGPGFLLATVRWRAGFAQSSAEWVSSYLLRRAEDGLRIAFTCDHEAMDDVLRRAGVARPVRRRVPAKAPKPEVR